MDAIPDALRSYGGLLAACAAVAAALAAAHRLLQGRTERGAESRLPRQLVLLLLGLLGLVVVILALPVAAETRNQLLSLLGIVLTGVIAFASTSLVANIMAGIMLRAVRGFRPGDFVQAGEHFGRVTERGLFHVEIQTESSDLTTLPNLFLATHPTTVTRAEGTFVAASLSLGYDIPPERIERELLTAASDAGLEEPFVRIDALGDFSVTYRISGLLTEVKRLLSARSNLRGAVLRRLHGAGIEIVSPSFMHQRRLDPEAKILPPVPPGSGSSASANGETADPAPDAIIFSKAEAAERFEQLRAELQSAIDGLVQRLAEATAEDRPALEAHINRRREQLALLQKAREREDV